MRDFGEFIRIAVLKISILQDADISGTNYNSTNKESILTVFLRFYLDVYEVCKYVGQAAPARMVEAVRKLSKLG